MQYSLYYMLKEAYEQRKKIYEYYQKKKEIENYEDPADAAAKTIIGLSIETFLFVLILQIIIFIYSIVLLIEEWDNLHPALQILCTLLTVFQGNLLSIIIILINRQRMKKKGYTKLE